MKHHRWLDMMRLFNRICAMDRSKLPRLVLEWDYKAGAKGWLGDMLKVCTESNIPPPTELRYVYDLEPIQSRFLRQCREEWKGATEKMPKLDTYHMVKDFAEPAVLAKSNLLRNERSLVSHLLCGILPLEVETGRFNDKKRKKERAQRHCKVCEQQEVEDELHFLFICKKLSTVREENLDPILKGNRDTRRFSNAEKLKWLLGKEQIKQFGQAIACLYQKRHDVMYIGG